MLKVLLVLIILAVATYALIRVVQHRGDTPPLAGTRRTRRPTGPLGPDDDEEFLRDLDRKRFDGEGPDNAP